MSTQKMTILAINVKEGVSSKTGRPYKIFDAQCVITSQREGKEPEVQVGTILLHESLKDTAPGDYLPSFHFSVRDGQLWPVVSQLRSLDQRPVASPKAA